MKARVGVYSPLEFLAEDEGYPIELFVSLDYKDRLMCPICYNIPRDMVCCVEKEHFFCRACILKALAKKRSCPCCRTYLTVATLKTHTWAIAALDKAVVRCLSATRYYSSGRNEYDDADEEEEGNYGFGATAEEKTSSSSSSSFMSAGATTLAASSSFALEGKAVVARCGWTGHLKDLDTHMLGCPSDLVACPNSGCTWRIHRSELDFHATTCRYLKPTSTLLMTAFVNSLRRMTAMLLFMLVAALFVALLVADSPPLTSLPTTPTTGTAALTAL